MVIAIDGQSYVGKTTISVELARKLNYTHINTGLFYRILAKILIEENKLNVPEKYANFLKINFFKNKYSYKKNIINKINLTDLENNEIIRIASQIAKQESVRKIIDAKIIQLKKYNNFIIEGRQLTQGLFCDADWKIFIYAEFNIRLSRFKKLYKNKKKKNIDFSKILKDIDKRELKQFGEIPKNIKGIYFYDNSKINSASEDAEYLYNQINNFKFNV